jgi:hypothetical protein
MMPHTIGAPVTVEDVFEFHRATCRGVFVERPLARPPRDRGKLAIVPVERRNRLIARRGDEDLVSGLEEFFKPGPRVGEDRYAAGGRLEQPP